MLYECATPTCHEVFCETCLSRNLGPKEREKIEADVDDKWRGPCCNPEVLSLFRALTDGVLKRTDREIRNRDFARAMKARDALISLLSLPAEHAQPVEFHIRETVDFHPDAFETAKPASSSIDATVSTSAPSHCTSPKTTGGDGAEACGATAEEEARRRWAKKWKREQRKLAEAEASAAPARNRPSPPLRQSSNPDVQPDDAAVMQSAGCRRAPAESATFSAMVASAAIAEAGSSRTSSKSESRGPQAGVAVSAPKKLDPGRFLKLGGPSLASSSLRPHTPAAPAAPKTPLSRAVPATARAQPPATSSSQRQNGPPTTVGPLPSETATPSALLAVPRDSGGACDDDVHVNHRDLKVNNARIAPANGGSPSSLPVHPLPQESQGDGSRGLAAGTPMPSSTKRPFRMCAADFMTSEPIYQPAHHPPILLSPPAVAPTPTPTSASSHSILAAAAKDADPALVSATLAPTGATAEAISSRIMRSDAPTCTAPDLNSAATHLADAAARLEMDDVHRDAVVLCKDLLEISQSPDADVEKSLLRVTGVCKQNPDLAKLFVQLLQTTLKLYSPKSSEREIDSLIAQLQQNIKHRIAQLETGRPGYYQFIGETTPILRTGTSPCALLPPQKLRDGAPVRSAAATA